MAKVIKGYRVEDKVPKDSKYLSTVSSDEDIEVFYFLVEEDEYGHSPE